MIINFYCRASKANRHGESPIEAGISHNGQRKFFNLPMTYRADRFEKDSRKGKLKEYLSAMESNIKQAVMELAAQGQTLTFSAIKDIIKKGGVRSYTLQDGINDFLKLIDSKNIDKRSKKKFL